MRVVIGERHGTEANAARSIPREVGSYGDNESAREKSKLGEKKTRHCHL